MANFINPVKINIRGSRFFLYLFFLLFLGLATGCSTHSKSGVSLVSDALLSHEDERMLWEKSRREQRALENSGFLYADQDVEAYLNRVVARLRPPSVSADMVLRVKVIKNAYLNAFAYPNGMIFIHTGLLARMDNEDQLAAVLAHEMIHCIQRHALRAFRKYRDQPALLTAVQHTLLNTPSLQEMARFMGITGAIAAINGYARELEAEADRMGIELMARAGYNPKEALALFDHMLDEIEQEGLAEPFFFGSHPAVRQRAGNLQGLPDFAYWLTEPAARNNDIFLAKLGQILLDNARLDIRLGRFHSAGQGIEKLLRIHPSEPRAYFLLGEIYRQRGQAGDISRALKNYNRAISLDPDYAAAHKAVGLIHYKKGHRALAKKFFESCLQLSPNSSDKAYIQNYITQCERKKEG